MDVDRPLPATGRQGTVIANAVDDAFDGRLDIRDPVMTPERVRRLIANARRS